MRRSPLFIIFLIVFLDLVGFGMIIPILPYYASSFQASAFQSTLLMMCYSGMQFLFNPFWGRLSDKIGRRPVLLLSIAGIAGSMFILAQASSLAWLFAARILGGMFAANISTASAYIADITPPEERSKRMGGIIGVSFGLGFLLGPAIGGFLSKWGYGTAAFAVGSLSVLNWIFAFFLLREPQTHRQESTRIRVFDFHLLKKVWAQPKTFTPILLFFLVTFGFSQMEGIFGYFVKDRFHLDSKGAGYLHSLMALVMIPVQGKAIGRLVKIFGEIKLVFFGTLLASLALLGASLGHYPFFIFSLLVLGLGYSLINPSLTGLTSKSVSADLQGGTLGLYQGAGSLARTLAPPLAGLIYDHLGKGFPFWSAALFFALACGIGWSRLSLWKESLSQNGETKLKSVSQTAIS